MANNNVAGNHQQAQAISKPAPGKHGHGNTLPLWGNEKTMNLNPMILTNVLSSPYFKVQLYELKTYHEVVDEIYFKVNHVEPWEKGSRKTAGQTGMCGGVRGVGTGGIVSTAFCLLYKLFTLKMTRKQVMGLITHTDSPYIRALGFMYIRYTQPPPDLVDWYDGFLDDEEELDVKAGGGCMMTVGEMLRSFLTKLEWFSTLFPRIPVPVQKTIDQHMKGRPRKVPEKEVAEEEPASADSGKAGERRRSRSPRRTPSPRRSPKRSRSRSHHRERDRHGPSFDNELERERDRQRKERDGRDRGDRERRRSRSSERTQERRERRKSRSGSRERRRDKDREGGETDRNRRKDRDHHKDRGSDREAERSRDKKSKGEPEERRHKEDRERHREERKSKRSSRSRSKEKRQKSEKSSSGSRGRTEAGEEKSRKRDHSRERDREGDQRSHKRSRSKEKRQREPSNGKEHGKHSERRRSPSKDKLSS